MSAGIFYNGQQIISPRVVSSVNDDSMVAPGPTIGNKLVLIGEADDGQPKTELVFQNFNDAVSGLYDGDLLKGLRAAFNPSNEFPGPSKVSVIRVNPDGQASTSLLDASSNPVIDITSRKWGIEGNNTNVSVANGTKKGLMVTVAHDDQVYTIDNIHRDMFTIQYTGAQVSARMSITGTSLTLEAPSGTVVLTADLNVYNSQGRLSDYIHANAPGFALSTHNTGPTLNWLDHVTQQDVKAVAFTATANLQQVAFWLNTIPLINAVVHTGAGTLPALVANKYLTGGVINTVTNTDWSDCFTLLETIDDVAFICPLTTNTDIIAMADAHCQYMSNVVGSERRSFVGLDVGQTDDDVTAEALLLNSDRTALVHLGYYDYGIKGGLGSKVDGTDKLHLFPACFTAALIAGGFAALSPGTPMTNKSLNIRGIERVLRNPADTDSLIQGGVLCIVPTPTGFRVVQSVTTWQNDENYNRVEVSTGVALDFLMKNWRAALKTLVGRKGNPESLAQAISISETMLRSMSIPEPIGPGVLAGNSQNPAWKNLSATLVDDTIAVTAQVSPVIPVNYVTVTVYAVPFTGTVAGSQ